MCWVRAAPERVHRDHRRHPDRPAAHRLAPRQPAPAGAGARRPSAHPRRPCHCGDGRRPGRHRSTRQRRTPFDLELGAYAGDPCRTHRAAPLACPRPLILASTVCSPGCRRAFRPAASATRTGSKPKQARRHGGARPCDAGSAGSRRWSVRAAGVDTDADLLRDAYASARMLGERARSWRIGRRRDLALELAGAGEMRLRATVQAGLGRRPSRRRRWRGGPPFPAMRERGREPS